MSSERIPLSIAYGRQLLVALVVFQGLCTSHMAMAQVDTAYEEQSERIRAPKAVTSFGPDLFGDSVNMYNGQLSFQQTDVSLKGNDALPMAIGRRVTAGSGALYGYAFGRWELDIPHMYGVFPSSAGWTSGYSKQRCSNFAAPGPVVSNDRVTIWDPEEFWGGNFLYVPGSGDQMMLTRLDSASPGPGPAAQYPVVTSKFWYVSCLPSLKNDPSPPSQGEGFLAVSPDGTQYYFDWLVDYPARSMTRGGSGVLLRKTVWLLPSKIVDRFGNSVTYSYDTQKPRNLLRMVASDGRSLSLTYDPSGAGENVQTVSDGTRVWQYGYRQIQQAVQNSTELDSVTLPDNSAWSFTEFNPLLSKLSILKPAACEGLPLPGSSIITGSLTHPTGATGKFTLTPTNHGRSYVPRSCDDRTNSVAIPKYFTTLSLTNKTILGVGLGQLSWSYDYGVPNDSWNTCVGCPTTKTVTVVDSDHVTSRYTFGNAYNANEGRLELTELGWDGSSAVRSIRQRYRVDGPYPKALGSSLAAAYDDSTINTYLAPIDQRVITQQGTTFTWEATDFNVFVEPTEIKRSSSLGMGKTERIVYNEDDHGKLTGPNRWVLNKVKSITDVETGKEIVLNVYNDASNVEKVSKFGLPFYSMTYRSDGTLATKTDGRQQTTGYTDYMRGIPRRVQYADGTVEQFEVNNIGGIAKLTDANGLITSFGFDAMGRVSSITPPDEVDQHWNATTIDFTPVWTGEFDLEAGHWRQDVKTGNAVSSTYFDALWRPVYTMKYDSADFSGTASVEKKLFDASGRTTFQSYPQRSGASLDAGVHTEYDAIGQPLRVWSDSELGALTTTHFYEPGFRHTIVDARGISTTNSYQAFDSPDGAALSQITAPAGVYVAIERDDFAKPLSITRGGNGKSAVRSYVYDRYERLCKTIEPETGATIQDYDGAGNVAWRANGMTLLSASCDNAAGIVPDARKTSFKYDTRNRLATTTYGDGSPSIARTYTLDGLPATVTSNGAVWSYGYYNRRLNKNETLTYGGRSYVIARKYDANGSLSELAYPLDNLKLSYDPNALGQERKVGGYATGIAYYANGAVAGFNYGNGIRRSLVQNVRGLPERSTDAGVLDETYVYDANGNTQQIVDQLSGAATRTMTYDELDRLRTVSAPALWGNATYEYDALDNIVSTAISGGANARTLIHKIDPVTNRLDSISGGPAAFNFGYAYDAQGNITRRGTQTYRFDQGNRMTVAVDRATYAYDGLGRRISTVGADQVNTIQIYSQDGKLLYSGPSSGGGTKYIYLNNHVVAEVK